jgi:WD40 repeat protein/serine/threonine protein kinase
MNATTLRQDVSRDLRLACAELRERLRAGQATRVEELLADYPALGVSDEAMIELIHTEVVARIELGQRLTIEEWQERFHRLLPRIENVPELRDLFGSEIPTLSDTSATPTESGGSFPTSDKRLPRIRNYQLLQELGRGGMGVVYKARQTNLSRIVALKMILASEHAGLRERARLRNEAQATAQLLHPNVVQIYEIGEHDGLLYLVMEYVGGGNLARMTRSSPQAFRWSARLAETLARAIHVAHERGIVHRDLNPSNILMTTDGTPKISDFGLAKFLLDDQGLSIGGVLLGTPSYMAPEQVAGNGRSIGPTTDVYALGALLYEMLTGKAPFRGFTPMETMCQVMEADLVPPSRLRHGLPQDLETICLKCLNRDQSQRYATALDLADDLKRFQENQSIRARRTSSYRQAVHWMRRQPQVAALLGLCTLLFILLLVVTGVYNQYVFEKNLQLEHSLALENKSRSMYEIERVRYGNEASLLRRQWYVGQLNQAKQSLENGQIDTAQELVGNLSNVLGSENERGFEWDYLAHLTRRSGWTLKGHTAIVTCLATARRGRLLVSGDFAGHVLLWDPKEQEPLRCQGKHDGPVWKVAIAEAGPQRRAVVASLGKSSKGHLDLWLWAVESGQPLTCRRIEFLEAAELRFAPSGDILFLSGRSPQAPAGELLFWRLDARGHPGPMQRTADVAAWTPTRNGTLLAVGRSDGTIWLESLTSNAPPKLKLDSGAKALALCFSRDGKLLAAGRENHGVTVWDVGTGRIRNDFADHDGTVIFLDFCLLDQALVGCEAGGVLWTRRLDQPGPRHLLPGVEGQISSVCIDPEGWFYAAGGKNLPVTVWDLKSGTRLGSYRPGARFLGPLAFTANSQALFLACQDEQVRGWRFHATSDVGRVLEGHHAETLALAFSSDGSLLASGSADHTIKLWDVETERLLLTLRAHDEPVTALSFLPEKDLLASVGLDGKVILWNLFRDDRWPAEIAAEPTVLLGSGEPLHAVTTSTDCMHLAVAGSSGNISVWNTVSKVVETSFRGHNGPVFALTYSANPGVMASAGIDRTVRFWNMRSHPATPYTHAFSGAMRAVAFSSDGLMAVAGGDSGDASMWHMVDWKIRKSLTGHPLPIISIALAPELIAERRTIATACGDEKVHLWDATTGRRFYALAGHTSPVSAVVFSPDKKNLASCDQAGSIILWRATDVVDRDQQTPCSEQPTGW